MAVCPGLHATDVFQIAVCLVGLLLLLALVTAVRRGDGFVRGVYTQDRGRRSSLGFAALGQAAVPVLILGIEVLQLWDMLHSSSAASGPHLWIVEVVDRCIDKDQNTRNNGDSLWLAWMVPYLIVLLLFVIAVLSTILAEVLRLFVLPSLTESARESGAVHPSRGIDDITMIFSGVKDACCDAIVASVVALLAMHVSIIQMTFRGISCCFNQSHYDLNVDTWLWSSMSLFAVLLNIILPACAFVRLVTWRSRRKSAELIPAPLQRRWRTFLFTTSLIPCEPWLLWQLMGNLLVVAGFELAFAWDGNERARWLALAFVQLVFFFELMVLIWPRWLLDAPLLRFNIALRVSLLAAVCFHSLIGYDDSDIAWPLRMVIFFAVIRSLLCFYDAASASAIMRAGLALLQKSGWKKAETKTTIPVSDSDAKVQESPLFCLARDMSEVSLLLVLTDPIKFSAFCEDLSADERACLMSASELVTSRLLTTLPNEQEYGLGSDDDIRRSTVDLISAAMSDDILKHSTRTSNSDNSRVILDNKSHEEKQDWVAPLPLLESDQDDRSSVVKSATARRMSGKEKNDPMLTKKWLLDHFIPAANGPEFVDVLPLGASSVTPTTPPDNIISSSPARTRTRWSSDNILFRHPVTSTSAEELLKVNSKTASDILSNSCVRSFRSPGGSTSSCNNLGGKIGVELFTPGAVQEPSDVSPEEKICPEKNAPASATIGNVNGSAVMDYSSRANLDTNMSPLAARSLTIDSSPEAYPSSSTESPSPRKPWNSNGSDVSQNDAMSPNKQALRKSYSGSDVAQTDAQSPKKQVLRHSKSGGDVLEEEVLSSKQQNAPSNRNETSKGSERGRPLHKAATNLSERITSKDGVPNHPQWLSECSSDLREKTSDNSGPKPGEIDSSSDTSSNGDGANRRAVSPGPLETMVSQQGGSLKKLSTHRAPKICPEEMLETIESSHSSNGNFIASPMQCTTKEVYTNLLAVAPANSLLQLFNERFMKPPKATIDSPGQHDVVDKCNGRLMPDCSNKSAEPSVHLAAPSTPSSAPAILRNTVRNNVETEVISYETPISDEMRISNITGATERISEEMRISNITSVTGGDDITWERNSERNHSGHVSMSGDSVWSPASAWSHESSVLTRDLLQTIHSDRIASNSSLPPMVAEEPEKKEVKRSTVKYTSEDYAGAKARLEAALEITKASLSANGEGLGASLDTVPTPQVATDDSSRENNHDMGDGSAEACSTEEEGSPEQWIAWKARKEAKKVNSRSKYGTWLRGMADSYGGMGRTNTE